MHGCSWSVLRLAGRFAPSSVLSDHYSVFNSPVFFKSLASEPTRRIADICLDVL